ncbi:MAG: PepSY-associated TM helix domain-containing protein [Bacteroidales bacterium]|nr:PepSY-associated TM helix domain-containing protein [Bacteroidales bacterium]
MITGKRIFKTSRWIHKYPGLVLLLFLAWMSLSGVLLNHPGLVRGISVAGFLVPGHYNPENWNRSGMKGLLQFDSLTYFAYGNEGIYVSENSGKSFTGFMDGNFPNAAWKRRTNHLVCLVGTNQLLAATNTGLFISDLKLRQWQQIILPGNLEPVQKILFKADTCIVVTKSAFYTTENNNLNGFTRIVPGKAAEEEHILMFRAFLELHDGSIWGLPGKLLWDIAGLILFFLCFSAFYVWYYPKKWRRNYKRKNIHTSKTEKKRRSFFLRYHKKLGWYAAILLIIIFFTGIFLRLPLLITIAQSSLAKKYYPAWKHKNPWHEKINNALFNSQNNRLMLECTDGLWAGDISGQLVFEKMHLPVPIFAMGATVFEEESPDNWLIGSFAGLFRFSLSNSRGISLLSLKTESNRGRPSSVLVTGYVAGFNNTNYVLDHYKGLCDVDGTPQPTVLPMPAEIKQNFRMSLWNFLFELHNARIFQGAIGGFYILIIPLFGMISLLILMSGVFDYWYVKLKKSNRTNN